MSEKITAKIVVKDGVTSKLKKAFSQALEGVTITKDNIAEYYEFMSDEDIENNLKVVSDMLKERSIVLFKLLFGSSFVDVSKIENHVKSNVFSDGVFHGDSNIFSYCIFYSISYFGVKDTLKPIDEYIAEIKGSEAYKAHILVCILKRIEAENEKNGFPMSKDDTNEKIIDILSDYFFNELQDGLDIDSEEFLLSVFRADDYHKIRDAEAYLA